MIQLRRLGILGAAVVALLVIAYARGNSARLRGPIASTGCDIVGTWSPDGASTVTIDPTGAWTWTHGETVTKGTWRWGSQHSLFLRDESATAREGERKSEVCDPHVEGQYTLAWSSGCDEFRFEMAVDSCVTRGRVLAGAKLSRARGVAHPGS